MGSMPLDNCQMKTLSGFLPKVLWPNWAEVEQYDWVSRFLAVSAGDPNGINPFFRIKNIFFFVFAQDDGLPTPQTQSSSKEELMKSCLGLGPMWISV